MEHPSKEETKTVTYKESEKEVNHRILKITMTIKEEHPELSKYLEEMPVTIPDEKDPEITLKNLKAYHDSLNTMLNKYLEEQAEKHGV